MSTTRRGGEAMAIRDFILQRFPEPGQARFVILGDCNDGKTSRAVSYLQKRGRTEIAQLLPASDSRGEQWSYAFRREQTYARVDQIFVSPALAAAVQGGAATIYDGEGVREASDHRPLVVVLELPEKQ
jgi:predicted extracellular nuclease